MKHDYLKTSVWYREKIKNPYRVIAAFFSAADLAYYRKIIRQCLKAAHSNRYWKKGNAGDLLNNFKLIESLINAAYLINKVKNKSAAVITTNNLFQKDLYSNTGSDDWNCFPRSLSMKEYIDPYTTFRHFFYFMSLPEWKKELSYVLDYALTDISLFDAGIEIDTLSLYLHLTKLVEAAHLINVREIAPQY